MAEDESDEAFASLSGRNLYAVLNVPKSAPIDEIRTAYRSRSMEFHPDRQRVPEERSVAASTFHDVSLAYHVLSDPIMRQAYDMHGIAGVRLLRDQKVYQLVAQDPGRSASALRSLFLEMRENAADEGTGRSSSASMKLRADRAATAASMYAVDDDPWLLRLPLGALRLAREQGVRHLLPVGDVSVESSTELAAGETEAVTWSVDATATGSLSYHAPLPPPPAPPVDGPESVDDAWMDAQAAMGGLFAAMGGDAPGDGGNWSVHEGPHSGGDGPEEEFAGEEEEEEFVFEAPDEEEEEEEDVQDPDPYAEAEASAEADANTGVTVTASAEWKKSKATVALGARLGVQPAVMARSSRRIRDTTVDVECEFAGTELASAVSARRALTTHIGSNLKLSMHQSRGGRQHVQAAASLSHVHDKGSNVLSLISTSESGVLLEGRGVYDAGGGFRVMGSATSLLSLLAYQALARGVLGVPRILWLYSLTGGWHYRHGLQREVQVAASLRGNEASLRVELSRGKHSLALPIVLAPHASIKHTVGAALATAAAGWILRALRGRQRRRDAFSDLRKKLAEAHRQLGREVVAALAQQRMMQRQARRVQREEEERGGMVIQTATFGVADAHGTPDAQVPSDGQEALRQARDAARDAEGEEGWSAARRRAARVMDVRCALQHAVRGSEVHMGGPTRHLIGFAPSMGEPLRLAAEMQRAATGDADPVRCSLRVRYTLGRAVYEVELDDAAGVHLPSPLATRVGDATWVH